MLASEVELSFIKMNNNCEHKIFINLRCTSICIAKYAKLLVLHTKRSDDHERHVETFGIPVYLEIIIRCQ